MIEKKQVNPSGIKITKIHIDKFRRFHHVDFNIGNNITLVCGKNCTSKSTMLGLLCQPLSFGEKATKKESVYLDSYHEIDLTQYKTLTGISFKRDAYEIFRLSKTYDIPKEMIYSVFFDGEPVNKDSRNIKDGLRVRSEPRTTTKKTYLRFVTGKFHEAGEGNFPHPLIYLGLERLYPLASCENVEIKDTSISDEDKAWCDKMHNDILLLNEYEGEAETVQANVGNGKHYLGHRTSTYNSESCSAGQDNIGQILTAILSFKKLKEELQESYQGGVLLIDELDSTLHPQAQEHLLRVLKDASEKYNLQVIATTHSLYMLQTAFKSELTPYIKVIHLERVDDNIVVNNNPTYDAIADYLMVKTSKKNHKTTVLLEDPVAANIFNLIVGCKLKNYIEIPDVHISGQFLIQQSSIKVKCFQETLFIIDGDLKKLMPGNLRKNLLSLPMELSPEKEFYFYLKQFNEIDVFWQQCGETYTKSVCFKDHPNYHNHQKLDIENRDRDKKKYKDWYCGQFSYWGDDGEFFLSRWILDNKDACYEFCKKTIASLENIRNEKFPQGLKDKICEQYVEQSSPSVIVTTVEKDSEKEITKKGSRKKAEQVKNDNDSKDAWGIVQPTFGF